MVDVKTLDPIPGSDDAEFWEHADVNVHDKREEWKPCDHKFVQKSGMEVECINCRAGYELSEKMYLRDGHIYYDDELLI